jgi:hypothetical protein
VFSNGSVAVSFNAGTTAGNLIVAVVVGKGATLAVP